MLFFRACYFVLIFQCSFCTLSAAEIHALIFCDTDALKIEESVVADYNHLHEHVNRIAKHTQLPFHIYAFSGKNALPDRLKNTIDSLKVSADDFIIFYFSGHGYRTHSKSGNPWPNLYVTHADQGIDFNWVTLKLLAKKPNFLLSLSDCCNHFMAADESSPPLVEMSLMEKGRKSMVIKNYKKLFLETKGALMIASAIAGQQSWCYPNGGVYTNAFFESLRRHTERDDSISWEIILNDAKVKVAEFQKPLYQLLTQ